MRSAMILSLFVCFSVVLDSAAPAPLADDLQGMVGVGGTMAPPENM